MDDRVKRLHELALTREHHKYRRRLNNKALIGEFTENKLSAADRMTRRLQYVLKNEIPVVFKEERIAFVRTCENLPELFTEQELKAEKGIIWDMGNVCPNYIDTIDYGLDRQRARCVERAKTADESQKAFLNRIIDSIDAVFELCERYRKQAKQCGNEVVADILSRIPHSGAKTFNEALQFFRILHFTLWCEGSMHNGIGRFDQYMYKYWRRDIDSGEHTKDELYSLLTEFFISFNRDNDLYPGVQKGDNGQSMMLGGTDRSGNYAFNELSSACLKASGEIMMIDPKINLRVGKNAPLSVYKEGSELTKKGLGFPQYSNDDVVINGLVNLGYELEDARDYTVAACWEFIIPGRGMEVPNIDAYNYVDSVNRAVDDLESYKSFDELFSRVKSEMNAQVDRLVKSVEAFSLRPAPFMSLLTDGCVENASDISNGAKYNNYGFHGVGFASAVDALSAVKRYVFDEKTVSAARLLKAVRENYENDPELASMLRYRTPKFGDNDKYTDEIACSLMKAFSESLKGRKNSRGGIFRPGTGSAMYYLWHAKEKQATAGGLKKEESFESNYSPSLYVHSKGPLSVIKSFTRPDLESAINGGPLTMEFHSSVFKGDEGTAKVAELVRQFIKLGGHQLQLNSVSRESLLDAQKHPENYQNLIVRVWGWSAYFVKLDREYQDHIIARQEYRI